MYINGFTTKTEDTISVNEIIKDLIPGFIKNKENEIQQLQQMLEKNDFNKIKKMGHNWKGACPSYGFHYLGEMGKQFENLVQNKDYLTLKAFVGTLPSYFKNLDIKYYSEENII